MIIVIAGIGELSKSLIIAVGCFFPVFFGAFTGIRSADPKLVELATVHGKGSFEMTRQVLLPSAVPWILPAMKSALGLGWVLLVVAEVVASSEGLGWLMWDARTYRRLDEMMVGMIVAGLLGAITIWLLDCIQRRLLFWRPAFEGS